MSLKNEIENHWLVWAVSLSVFVSGITYSIIKVTIIEPLERSIEDSKSNEENTPEPISTHLSEHEDKIWLSAFRDVDNKTGEEEIITAKFSFSVDDDGIITGKEDASNNEIRSWENTGKVHSEWAQSNQGPFHIVNYKATPISPEMSSVGTIVLEPVSHSLPVGIEEYQGYWMGHEPTLDKIIACPYVLSSTALVTS